MEDMEIHGGRLFQIKFSMALHDLHGGFSELRR
jgi:hypothetical protein